VGCYSSRTQVRHAAPVVFPVDFDGGEHVYRVHPINVQLVTDPMIMPAKEEHRCHSGSENLDKHEPRDILHFHVAKRDQAVAEGQNDRIMNIISVYYGIQCFMNNFELRATIMTNYSPYHNASASKTVGLVHTLVRKTFATPAIHTITSIAKTK